MTKLVGDSKRRLLDLSADGAQFDLVYVDGSHLGPGRARRCGALVEPADAATVSLVFDDYRWADLGDGSAPPPGPAIDVFRELVAAKHEVVFANDQIALRRIS